MRKIYGGFIKNIAKYCLSPAIVAKIITNGQYKLPKHIRFLDNQLFKLLFTKNERLIICLPPRHGKSELISKYLPFWYLCSLSNKRVILTSYEAQFAASWGRKVRDLVMQFGQSLYSVGLSDSAASINYFELSNGSAMSTAGAGGALTGKGADLLIIDDPIKNDEEAHSPTIRNNIWDWFLSTAYTRIEPGGSCIIIMTRWHQDDLVGRLLESYSQDWKIVRLPAIAEENDPLGRNPGEALWNERFNLERLNSIKQQLGSYWFNALYQQNPLPRENTLFKQADFRYYKIIDNTILFDDRIVFADDCTTFATADLAVSMNEQADFSVFLVFNITPDRIVLLRDILRVKTEPTKHLQIIKNLTQRYNIKLWGIESTQYQVILAKSIAREGIPVKELHPRTDKFARALPMAAMMEAGRVFFPQQAVWLDDFQRELLLFPASKHDDQVDAFTYIPELIPENGSLHIIGKKISRNVFPDF